MSVNFKPKMVEFSVMAERFEPITAKSQQTVELGGNQYSPAQLFSDKLHFDSKDGWGFGVGDPEFWKFSDKLLVRDGKLLDLGMGFVRTSTFFALNGMSVTGYDTNPKAHELANALKDAFGIPIEVKTENFGEADLGENTYDTVLLAQVLLHSPSEEAAFNVLGKAIKEMERVFL